MRFLVTVTGWEIDEYDQTTFRKLAEQRAAGLCLHSDKIGSYGIWCNDIGIPESIQKLG